MRLRTIQVCYPLSPTAGKQRGQSVAELAPVWLLATCLVQTQGGREEVKPQKILPEVFQQRKQATMKQAFIKPHLRNSEQYLSMGFKENHLN